MFSILLPKNFIWGEEVQRNGNENDCACVHLYLLEFSREALCAFGLRRLCHDQPLMILCVCIGTGDVTSQRYTPKGSKPETSEGAVLHKTTRWHPAAV